ncbi:MAG: methylmalonyl-CoA mutase family protein, partial [Trebonia sp.]
LYSQLVLQHEVGVTRSADPLGGSYLVEYLTDAFEQRVKATLATIEQVGGLVAATESGWVHHELVRAAFAAQQAVETGEQLVVGVNLRAEEDDSVPVEPFQLPPDTLSTQTRRLAIVRARRDRRAWQGAIDDVEEHARDGRNVVPAVIAAVTAEASVGEIGAALRRAFGSWDFPLW